MLVIGTKHVPVYCVRYYFITYTIQGMASEDKSRFVCRKGFHAINVQAVVDSKLRYFVNKETLFI
jgi:hypothetical protein